MRLHVAIMKHWIALQTCLGWSCYSCDMSEGNHSCRKDFANLQNFAKQKNSCLQLFLNLWIRKSTRQKPYLAHGISGIAVSAKLQTPTNCNHTSYMASLELLCLWASTLEKMVDSCPVLQQKGIKKSRSLQFSEVRVRMTALVHWAHSCSTLLHDSYFYQRHWALN